MTTHISRLTPEVVRSGAPGYEAARKGWNQLYQRHPAAIVFCRDTAEVVDAVAWARASGLPLRARSGRHHLEGWSSVDGGVVIDVSRLKAVEVDHAARTAVVGCGLTQSEAVTALGRQGWAIPTGSEGGVGLGGVVLGGGFGLLTRRLGLTCDRLVAAEVVVANRERSAKVINASLGQDVDLLWACRGGGGNNFGIATSYTMELEPLAEVAFGYVTWAGHGDLAGLVRAWQREAPGADERLSSALEIGSDGVALTAVWYGGTAADLEAALAPLLAVGAPEIEILEGAWPTIYADVDKAPDDVASWKFFSQFVKRPLPDEAIEVICRFMADTPSPTSNYFMSSFGGAVRREPLGGSAFPHRDALFYCEPGAGWNEPELSAAALGWVADFANALRPYVDGAYVNVPNAGAATWEADYYGANRDRLRAVKAAYDPQNVFRFEQSVPLA
jgi:FAD/FMN-containing dehydrogenase